MANKIVNNSGFAFINTGKISSCQSRVHIKGKSASGFCNSNTGEITNSSSLSKARKGSKFYSSNRGKIELSYFLNLKDQIITNFENKVLSKKDDIQQAKKHIDIDLSDVKVENSDLDNYTPISTTEDLVKFRDSVNNSIPEYVNGKFKLTNDINLSDMEWKPIGSELSPFKGKFDGNGFSVRGFIVKDKAIRNSGFFGVIENAEVFNLTVDGLVKSGVYSGIMAGYSNNSKIYSCAAAGKVSSGNCAAGFVGKNTGTINQCYCVGKVSVPTSSYLWPLLILLILLFTLIGCLVAWHLMDSAEAPLSAVMEEDPDIQKLEEAEPKEQSSGNSLTIICNQNLVAATANSPVVINYKNPATSTHSCKLTLRAANDDNSNSIIAESGLIPPGTYLEKLQLHEMSSGKLLEAGAYEVYLTIEAYDKDTQEKSNIRQKMVLSLKIGS